MKKQLFVAPLQQRKFDEIVAGAERAIFDGLVTGGLKGMRSAIFIWTSHALNVGMNQRVREVQQGHKELARRRRIKR